MKRSMWLVIPFLFLFALPSFQKDLFYQGGTDQSGGTDVSQPPQGPQLTDTSYAMKIFVLNYADVKQVKDTLKDILSGTEAVSANEGSNSVVVRASAKTLDRVAAVIKEMDVPPLQVNVEARILELKSGSNDTTNPSSLGVSWKYYKTYGSNNSVQFFSAADPTAAASAEGLYAAYIGDNITAYLQALDKQIGYDFVAAPWISATNHKEASILIGQKIGYTTLFTSTTGTLQGIDYINVGTQLKFTPHISSDGYIRMDINPSLSDGILVNGVPQTNNTETKNTVLIKDGQTVVIGGLTRDFKNETTSGVPFLSEIPFLGTLFRSRQINTEKREIMILITPHIVTPAFLKDMQDRSTKLDLQRQKERNDGEPTQLIY